MNCPVCLNPGTSRHSFTGNDLLFETTDRAFAFSACGGCRSLFIDPAPRKEELADFYPSRYWWTSSPGPLNKLESIYRRFVLRDHLAFIVKAASQTIRGHERPVRLLDVGCGGASLLGELKRKGFGVTGFDASSYAASAAKADHGIEVLTGARLQDANFPTAAFDVVTLFHVMEHVLDPRDLLTEVRRILHPGGRVVVQVPNIESWQARLFGIRWYGLDVPRHVINYSSQSIRQLLSDSGFKTRRMRHFNLRDNAPALASSVFPGLDPVSRRVRSVRSRISESGLHAWARHALYLTAVAMAFPFAIAESLVGSGATVMIEAEKS
jgi:2-polyprenyl-3-methyl-5-hydroxy-6-metoxy-1,4-benzoquinol methylase